VYTVLFIIELN